MSGMRLRSNVAERRIDMIRSIQPFGILPKNERFKYKISDVKKDGVIRFDQRTFKVIGVSSYTEADSNWQKKTAAAYSLTELVLFDFGTARIWYLDWSLNAASEIEITLGVKKLGSEDKTKIFYTDGTSVDIADIAKICKGQKQLCFDKLVFEYREDSDMVYEPEEGESTYINMAEFEGRFGLWFTVESWSSSPEDAGSWGYDIWVSKNIYAEDIEIIALGA